MEGAEQTKREMPEFVKKYLDQGSFTAELLKGYKPLGTKKDPDKEKAKARAKRKQAKKQKKKARRK